MALERGRNRQCSYVSESDNRCGKDEIEGLEYCLSHMPDDLLEEAEGICGYHRCRHQFGAPDACRRLAINGSSPPVCPRHVQPYGRRNAEINIVENNLAERLQAIMSGQGAALMDPPAIGDPLREMLTLAAEMKALKEILREQFAELVSLKKLRYANPKAGEQLRAETLLYERALERFSKILIDISKMKIDERLAGVQEKTANMMEAALDAALEESGVGIDGKLGARKAFYRNLKVLRGELIESS